MQYGVSIMATDRTIDIVSLAPAVEERGFESLWVPEHLHIPVDRMPYPLAEDGVLPEPYKRTYDPFVSLAMAAAVTRELKLGTGVCLVSERDPILLAKEVASLDRLSGGRFLFGIGAGWLRQEMEALGTAYETRWKLTEERVAALKLAWTEDEVSYSGEFVNIPPTLIYPKPVQRPHPPIYIGAASRWARRRVAAWADGWLPNVSDPRFLERGIADIRARAEQAGRDPGSICVSVFGADSEALDEYARIGVERCVFGLPSAPAEEVMPALDRFAKHLGAHG